MELLGPLIKRMLFNLGFKGKGNLSSPLNYILRSLLFIIILILFVHLPDINHLSMNRSHIINEIIEIMERHQIDFGEEKREELASIIYDESIRYNQDPKFVLALILIESSFKNHSVSEKGAMGLMQLMPYVAQSLARDLGIDWKGDHLLFDPSVNIKIGIHYLSQLIFDFNDLRIALTAYNYGPNYIKGLMERKKRIPFDYYNKVITTYHNLISKNDS